MNEILIIAIVIFLFVIIPTIQIISDYMNYKKFDKAIKKLLEIEDKLNRLIGELP